MALEGRDDWLTVAWVKRPWGRHGAVIAELHTDWPEQRLAPGAMLTLESSRGEREERRLASVRFTSQGAIAAFECADDIAAARRLVGARIVARRSELGDLGEDLHRADLVGLEVVGVRGERLGRVEDVEEGIASDLLVVETCAGQSVLVPLAPAICTEIDLARRIVVLDPPLGLLDPDAAETVDPGGES